jgi:hypothetical protein
MVQEEAATLNRITERTCSRTGVGWEALDAYHGSPVMQQLNAVEEDVDRMSSVADAAYVCAALGGDPDGALLGLSQALRTASLQSLANLTAATRRRRHYEGPIQPREPAPRAERSLNAPLEYANAGPLILPPSPRTAQRTVTVTTTVYEVVDEPRAPTPPRRSTLRPGGVGLGSKRDYSDTASGNLTDAARHQRIYRARGDLGDTDDTARTLGYRDREEMLDAASAARRRTWEAHKRARGH